MTTIPNILDVHSSILELFHSETKELSSLEKTKQELTEMVQQYSNGEVQSVLDEQLSQVQNRIQSIVRKNNAYYYMLESTPLLEEYKVHLSKPVQVNFMSPVSSVGGKTQGSDSPEMKTLETMYLNITKTYDIINKGLETTLEPLNITCSTCQSVGSQSFITHDHICTCKYCGTEQDILQTKSSFNDVDRICSTTKYQYDRRVHFKECIHQFQGKQNSSIKPEIYEQLIHQLDIHGLVHSDTSLSKQIRFERVTKTHISIFLKEIGYSSHYEDLNLIYHIITGHQLDDISFLEGILMDDFDKLSKLYDEEYIKTRKITRKNFINTQYVLYQLLKRHKYPCQQSDFSFLKTIERKGFHDDICSHLFKKLGWNFHPIF
jgi:hypothetical protein